MKFFYIDIDLDDEITGLTAISLVDKPAVEKDFLKFSSEKLKFFDEDKHIITGVSLLADTPIYRYSSEIGEYYVVFSKEVIKKIVEKYSREGKFNLVNLDHDDSRFVQNSILIESYIVDKERGICPIEFSDVPDGSWITTFKINDEQLWLDIKSEKYKGFSVQGMFDLDVQMKAEYINKKEKDMKISKFVSDLLKLKEVVSDKGILIFDNLEIGQTVMLKVSSESDELIEPEDGEYKIDDKVIVIESGIIKEVIESETEEQKEDVKEEIKEDVKEEIIDETAPILSDLVTTVQLLEEEITELKAEIKEIKESLKKDEDSPIIEETIVDETSSVEDQFNKQPKKLFKFNY